MKNDIRENLEYSEEKEKEARKGLEKAKKTLEESPRGEKTDQEIKGVKYALAGSERVEKESGKSHRIREETHEQRAETQRLMREADREIKKTDRKIEETEKK